MKNSKNYFLSFLFFVLLAAGCSSEADDGLPEATMASTMADAQDKIPPSFITANNGENSRGLVIEYFVREFIFSREGGANGLGHVGVAFRYIVHRNGMQTHNIYYWGGVENPNGHFFIWPGQNNGGFVFQGSWHTMMADMKSKGYTRYKIRNANRKLAYQQVINGYNKLINFPDRGYKAIGQQGTQGNNCADACEDVLWELKTPNVANMAFPYNWAPNNWFNNTNNGWNLFKMN